MFFPNRVVYRWIIIYQSGNPSWMKRRYNSPCGRIHSSTHCSWPAHTCHRSSASTPGPQYCTPPSGAPAAQTWTWPEGRTHGQQTPLVWHHGRVGSEESSRATWSEWWFFRWNVCSACFRLQKQYSILVGDEWSYPISGTTEKPRTK